MDRDQMLARMRDRAASGVPWDLAIIGGGATGVGALLDAAARGYAVCLVEQVDFGKGTSSRSTKLIHGGVRYLQQGNVSLVMEALKERGRLRRNAPHLVRDLAFVVPNYDWWETPFYGIGMKVYDMLAGKYGFGKSRLLGTEETLGRIPTLEKEGLRGGVLYYDGQFDDTRLLVSLARTAVEHGAVLVNHCRCVSLSRGEDDYLTGFVAEDAETGERLEIKAKCIVNATGAFSDGIRKMDDPGVDALIAPSQGIHIVLDRRFLPGDTAIMVPRTSDGRVLFAIPWHDRVVVGTTDTPIDVASLEPRPLDEEIAFVLETAAEYLATDPTLDDVLSVFTGIRPLVSRGKSASTAALSRDHTIEISKSGLLTITGGKWTTYRKMAESCVDHAATLGALDDRPCVTRELHLHGHDEGAERHGSLAFYGSDAPSIRALADAKLELGRSIHPRLEVLEAQVAWAAREEMARTVEDVLARRTRALFLDAKAALEAAPTVARVLAEELGRDEVWQASQVKAFSEVAQVYCIPPMV